jgi:hypothetical protein
MRADELAVTVEAQALTRRERQNIETGSGAE